jgi:hypothetical protein
MRKAVFTIGEYPKAYIGYTSGRLWNGWATPHFELAEAKRVAEGFNETAEFPMQYDEVYDQFYILDTETSDLETWKGIDVPTNEGIKHLYDIGAYSWVWDEAASNGECRHLAQVIEDFIYEFDTYEAKDQYDSREEMVEAIQSQLKELTTFQQVYEIWNGEDLTSEEIFNKLREVLKV